MYADISLNRILAMTLLFASLSVGILLAFSVKSYTGIERFSLNRTLTHAVATINSLKEKIIAQINGDSQLASPAGANAGVFSVTFPNDGRGNAIDVPVLVYHGIVGTADKFSMTQKTFRDQMTALKRAGYYSITVDDFKQFINGTKTLPDKAFLLTFDDGRADSYNGADPVLRQLGFHAVMFVATADSLHKDLSADSYYLDEPALKDMIDSGYWELGSHAVQENTQAGLITVDAKGTLGNFLSNKKWLATENRLETREEYTARVNAEISNSKRDLDAVFGIHVVALSYPFSDYGEQSVNNPDAISVIADAMKKNYEIAFQQTWPSDASYILNYPDMDHLHLRRIEAGTKWSGDYLIKLLDNGRSKDLPYTDQFESDNGWRGTWGEETFSNGALQLQNSKDNTGAFAFLDGTRGYQNYMYTVDVSLKKGHFISLVSRFVDSNNNLSCVFSADTVRIEQKINGKTTVLVHVKNEVVVPFANATLGMSVDGQSVKCYEGSKVMAYAGQIGGKLAHGGIALEVWDPKKNNAQLLVTKLQIVSIPQGETLKKSLPTYKMK